MYILSAYFNKIFTNLDKLVNEHIFIIEKFEHLVDVKFIEYALELRIVWEHHKSYKDKESLKNVLKSILMIQLYIYSQEQFNNYGKPIMNWDLMYQQKEGYALTS